MSLYDDIENILAGWYTAPLTAEDVQEIAREITQYVFDAYGPPF